MNQNSHDDFYPLNFIFLSFTVFVNFILHVIVIKIIDIKNEKCMKVRASGMMCNLGFCKFNVRDRLKSYYSNSRFGLMLFISAS